MVTLKGIKRGFTKGIQRTATKVGTAFLRKQQKASRRVRINTRSRPTPLRGKIRTGRYPGLRNF